MQYQLWIHLFIFEDFIKFFRPLQILTPIYELAKIVSIFPSM